jgi:hypothetical protein
MSIWRLCDLCRQSKPNIQSYGLRRQIPRLDGSNLWTTRGAGSLDICLSCWERVAKPRMRPWKKEAFRNTRGLQNRER